MTPETVNKLVKMNAIQAHIEALKANMKAMEISNQWSEKIGCGMMYQAESFFATATAMGAAAKELRELATA